MAKPATIAKVAVPLPINRLFDYSIPETMAQSVLPGMRVTVAFNKTNVVGYVASLANSSTLNKVNPIIDCVDESPIFSPFSLKLANRVSEYYIASLGEVLDAMLPSAIKRSRGLHGFLNDKDTLLVKKDAERLYVQDIDNDKTGQFLKEKIIEIMKGQRTVLLVVPEMRLIPQMQEYFSTITGIRIGIWHGRLSKKNMSALWRALISQEIDILIGTRSSIFAPIHRLGLIIIYDENDPSHKDDQVPYYHSAVIARLRVEIEKCDLILSSIVPSASTYLAIKEKKLLAATVGNRNNTAKVVFTAQNFRDKVDIMLEREMAAALENKEKVLIFHNRSGFATFISCKKCKKVLQCERCSSNLHYDFASKKLFCPSCNYKITMRELCPFCNASYVLFEGLGIEKLASNLKRIFPSVAITTLKRHRVDQKVSSPDIVCTTSTSSHLSEFKPDITVIWNADSLFNAGDYSAAESAFRLLVSFLCNTRKKLIICSGLKRDFYAYKALETVNVEEFYENELKAREALKLPPFFHIGLIVMRGFNMSMLEKVSEELFEVLQREKGKGVVVSDQVDAMRLRLRGKHYRYIIVKSKNIKTLNHTIRHLFEKHKRSSTTITVNIDPL